MIGIARETGTGRFVRSNSPVLEGNPQSVTKNVADVSESLATTRHVSLKINSAVDGLQTALDGKLGKTETAVNSNKLEGYTRTEVLSQAYAQVGTMGKRNVFISPNDPAMTDGAVGDIWLKY